MTFDAFQPQLAKRAASVEEAVAQEGECVIEPKLDGWRLVAHVDEDGVHLYSRTGKRYDGRLPHVERELARFPAGTVLDGEALAADLGEDGSVIHRWGAAQSILGSQTHPDHERITFVVFDLLAHGGLDARPLAYSQRRQLLEGALAKGFDALQLIEQYPATQEAYEGLVARGYEGAVVKSLSARYASGARGAGWRKVKPEHTVDAFVVGFEAGRNGLTGRTGSLRLAQYGPDGVVEIGTCGSGISDALRDDIDADQAAWIGRVVEVVQLAAGGDNWSPMSYRRLRLDKAPEDCVPQEAS